MFAEPYDKFKEKLYAEMPNFYVEEVKILSELTATEFKECDSTPLPDVPVHFIMAGGYPTTPDDRGETIFDKKKLFRIDQRLKNETVDSIIRTVEIWKVLLLFQLWTLCYER